MSKDIQDSDSTVVVINGERKTVAEVKEFYANLEFLSKPSAMAIVEVLLQTKEPLSRDPIAAKAKLSVGYTITILNHLIKFGYAVQFRIGKRKLIYYALTEKGFDAFKARRAKTE